MKEDGSFFERPPNVQEHFNKLVVVMEEYLKDNNYLGPKEKEMLQIPSRHINTSEFVIYPPTADFEFITPDTAQTWLNKNVKNRPVSKLRVDKYAKEMLEGNWTTTGDPFRFDSDDNFIDGQHRCWAIIQSGITIQGLVVRGLTPESFADIDTGAKRTLSDVLSIQGEVNTKPLANALTWLHRLNDDLVTNKGYSVARKNPKSSKFYLDLLDNNPNIRNSVRIAKNIAEAIKFPKGLASAIHYIAYSQDTEVVEIFFERLKSGSNLEEGSPVLALRNWIMNQSPHRRPQPEMYAAAMIKCLNWFAQGRPMKIVQWKPAVEKFPTLKITTSEVTNT